MDRFMLKSVDFGRLMKSKATEMLILAFTSETGQFVAHNRNRTFLFGFSVKECIFKHFVSLISDSRVQGYFRYI